jgi:hypothetical protein
MPLEARSVVAGRDFIFLPKVLRPSADTKNGDGISGRHLRGLEHIFPSLRVSVFRMKVLSKMRTPRNGEGGSRIAAADTPYRDGT